MQEQIADGCQEYLVLERGDYLLKVSAPRGAHPMRFSPVLVGLSGTRTSIPEEYLRDLFQQLGAATE